MFGKSAPSCRMRRYGAIFCGITAIFVFCFVLSACSFSGNQREVVIYTSVDQVFSEPLLKQFEKDTGIKVLPIYDAEASKTTGLVNRLIMEKSNPRADVFWNGEFAQTIMLKEQGVLASYTSPNSKELPGNFKDADGKWTAFGGRARVFIINTSLLKPEQYPKSLFDLLDEQFKANLAGIANPVFGTTATQAAALYSVLGREKALALYQGIKNRGVQVVEGNSVTRDMVADGKLAVALTDTDDALSAIEKGKPVDVVFPDQEAGGLGTLIIPNTVAMVQGGPNPKEAAQLIDFLLSAGTEQTLIDAGWIDIPSRPSVKGGYYSKYSRIKGMDIDFYKVYQAMEASKKDMQEVFVR